MGRRKAKKPGRKKPLPWVIAQPTPPYRNIKPVTIPPGNHTLAVDPTNPDDLGTIIFEGGGRITLEDGDATVLATDPVTIEELSALIERMPKVAPPSDERATQVARILAERGYLHQWEWMAKDPENGRLVWAYKVTQKGHAYLRACLRATSEAQLPTPILTNEDDYEMVDVETETVDITTDDDALFMLTGYLFAELAKEQRPEIAEVLHAAKPHTPAVLAQSMAMWTAFEEAVGGFDLPPKETP